MLDTMTILERMKSDEIIAKIGNVPKYLPGVEIPNLARVPDQWQEELSEEEVTQVVCAKLHVETFSRFPVRTVHHPGIVDENVNLGLILLDLLGTLSN